MRVLLIDMRQGGDWSLDLIFAGLVKSLGPENVSMFPYRDKHISWPGIGNADWGGERRSLGYTKNNKLITNYPEEIIKRQLLTGYYDYVFLDERQESYEMFVRLGGLHSKVKVVVFAGHDRFWNDSPEKVARLYGKQLARMFLDNWNSQYDKLEYAKLINWSCNFDHYWDNTKRQELLKNKVYDICFMGYNSHPNRAIIIDHIEKKWGHLNNYILFERKPDTMEKFINKDEFFKIIAQTKICLNLSGAAVSGKALRFYEIPYVGSLLLSQKTDYKQLEPFEHKKHCLYFSNLEELDMYIQDMLSYNAYREIIAAAGHTHCMKKHSVEARIKYVLENI